MTDGKDDDGASSIAKIKELNDALSKPAVFFTYSLGNGADVE